MQDDTVELRFEDHQRFQDLLGHHDEHIKALERALGVRIGTADTTLLISGEPLERDLAARVLNELYDVLERMLPDCRPGRYLMSALGPGFTAGFQLLHVE